MTPPEWKSQDRPGSLQLWITALNEEARIQFLEAGTHVELFFIFGDEGLMEVVPIVGMEKAEVVSALKQMLAERNGYAFIHIAEATAEHMDRADKADMLLVHAESRDGLSVAHCSTVVLQGETKMLLDSVEVDGAELSGPFAHIFADING